MNFDKWVNGLFGFSTINIGMRDLNSDKGSGIDKKSPGGSSLSFIISNLGSLSSALWDE